MPRRKEWTIAEVEKEVRRLDPKLDPKESAFRCACFMLAGLIVGPSVRKIAAFMGQPADDEMRVWGVNLRRNGIWTLRQTRASWFEKDGGLAFWLDVGVAQGLLNVERGASP